MRSVGSSKFVSNGSLPQHVTHFITFHHRRRVEATTKWVHKTLLSFASVKNKKKLFL